MFCDVLLKDATIITMDDENPEANWIAITDGSISALGDNHDMPDAAHVYELKGKTILPGLIDTHVHGTLTGEFLQSIDLNAAKTINSVMEMLENKKNNALDIITAGGFSKEGYTGRMFTAEDLDEICSDKILLIYDRSYHGCYLNTKGLKAANIKPGMFGAVMEKGRLTGEINDDAAYYTAISNIMKNVDEATIKKYMKSVSDHALSKGVTTIHSLDGGDYGIDMPIWITWKNNIDLQVVNYWETLDVNRVIPYGVEQIGGCICLDGTRALRTMALSEPYNDDKSTRGILYYNDIDILNFVRKADSNNMQCSMHATGNRAIDQYIYILRQVIRENGQKHLRHRIEHFSYPTEEQIEMAVELELALPMQPTFSKLWDDGEDSLYKKRFGEENASKIEPIADILKAGGMVCGGSDSPVTCIDPLYGIDVCVNTENPHRQLSVKDALKLYTYNAAWAAHEETQKGTLEIGKNADIVILDSNPIINSKKIKTTNVEMTMVKGRIVYQKGQ